MFKNIFQDTTGQRSNDTINYGIDNGISSSFRNLVGDPMLDGDKREFQIDKQKRPNCHLNSDTYTVLKMEEDDNKGKNYVFYVITGKEFKKTGYIDTSRRYKGQIGYGICQLGWIDDVLIEDLDLEEEGLENAQGCGRRKNEVFFRSG